MKRFIWLLNIVLALSLLVAACAPPPPEKVVETVVVEVEVPVTVEVVKVTADCGGKACKSRVTVTVTTPKAAVKSVKLTFDHNAWLQTDLSKLPFMNIQMDGSKHPCLFNETTAVTNKTFNVEFGATVSFEFKKATFYEGARCKGTEQNGGSATPVSLFGPSSGSLPHEPEDNAIEEYKPGVSVADFIAEATFYNPYPSTEGDWDYGFLCRYLSYETFYLIRVESDGDWEHWVYLDRDWTKVEDGYISDLRTGADQSNRLRIIVIGDRGEFYVNGEFVASLDMSDLTDAGDISVATETARGSGIEGKVTRFEDFTVWSLD